MANVIQDREIREMVRSIIEPYKPLVVAHFDEGRTQNTVSLQYNGIERRVFYGRRITGFGNKKQIGLRCKRALRELGVDLIPAHRMVENVPRIGSFGAKLDEAMAANGHKPVDWSKPGANQPPAVWLGSQDAADTVETVHDLCPDAIAARNEKKSDHCKIEDKPMTEPAPLTNGHHMNGSTKADPNATKRVLLKHDEVITATRMLITYGTIDEKLKAFTYQEGWSDERIRDLVRPDAPVDRITDIRREHFGLLADERKMRLKATVLTNPEWAASVEDRLAKVESDLAKAMEVINQLK